MQDFDQQQSESCLSVFLLNISTSIPGTRVESSLPVIDIRCKSTSPRNTTKLLLSELRDIRC